MSAFITNFQTAMEINVPSGISMPTLAENYAWVDERLRELYYGYALSATNCDEFESAGLLKENWAHIDLKLEEMCAPARSELTFTYFREEEESLTGRKRKRSETDLQSVEEEAEPSAKRRRCDSGKYINIIPIYDYNDSDEELDLESDVSSISFEDEEPIQATSTQYFRPIINDYLNDCLNLKYVNIVSEDEEDQDIDEE